MKTQNIFNNNFSSNRTLEVSVWIITLLVVAILLVSSSASAMNVKFEEEAYIDDIPFNTEMIVSEITLAEFTFEEEANVNDIPFNTETVASEVLYAQAFEQVFQMADENEIDDIPFSTCMIASSLMLNSNDEIYACTK